MMRIACVQMFAGYDVPKNIQVIEEQIAAAAKAGARVAIFPELAPVSMNFEWALKYRDIVETAFSRWSSACKSNNIYAVIGTPLYDAADTYNGAIVYGPDGKEVHRHYKVNFAGTGLKSGSHFSLFELDGIPSSVNICWDAYPPEMISVPTMMGAKLIFHPHGSFGAPEEAAFWEKPQRKYLLNARAWENVCYVLVADFAGAYHYGELYADDWSRIVEPTGENIATPITRDTELLIGDIWPEKIDEHRAKHPHNPTKSILKDTIEKHFTELFGT